LPAVPAEVAAQLLSHRSADALLPLPGGASAVLIGGAF
jgi:hypothetical protein